MDKKTEALKLALEAGFDEAGSSTDEWYEAGIENIVRLVELAKHKALAEQPAQQPMVGQVYSPLQQPRGVATLAQQQEPGRNHWEDGDVFERIGAMIKQPAQQEPVAWYHAEDYKTHFTSIPSEDLIESGYWKPLYTSPPASKPWVGLTDEEELKLAQDSVGKSRHWLVAHVGAKLREKNA